MPVYYLPQITRSYRKIEITGQEFHHLTNVMRNQIGDEIGFTNGCGLTGYAEIISRSKTKAVIEIISLEEKTQSKPKIAVAFSLLRNKNDHFIVEKLTELGVKEFFPFESERTVRKASKNTTEKFIHTSISAIKQCENAFLPKIHEPKKLTKIIEEIKKNNYIPIYSSELEKEKILIDIVEPEKDYCLIIGPEGGFSENEFKMLNVQGINTFSLGNHVLRAETAAITASSQLLSIYLKSNRNYY